MFGQFGVIFGSIVGLFLITFQIIYEVKAAIAVDISTETIEILTGQCKLLCEEDGEVTWTFWNETTRQCECIYDNGSVTKTFISEDAEMLEADPEVRYAVVSTMDCIHFCSFINGREYGFKRSTYNTDTNLCRCFNEHGHYHDYDEEGYIKGSSNPAPVKVH